MATEFDARDFIETDYAGNRAQPSASPSAPAAMNPTNRPPTREELESQVSTAHQKLAELKQKQEALERERASLEEARRRRTEFQTGHEEMVQQLTRGIGILEEVSLKARREADQAQRSAEAFKEHFSRVQLLDEAGWTQENYNTELSRALTTLENARMELNSARVQIPQLTGQSPAAGTSPGAASGNPAGLTNLPLPQLLKLGLALTWPLALSVLLGVGALVLILARK